jgi:hypothetical protein
MKARRLFRNDASRIRFFTVFRDEGDRVELGRVLINRDW